MLKIFHFVCVAALIVSTNVFAAWSGAKSVPASISIDGDEFYQITTPEELAWFAAQVNAGYTEINAVLENDILLGSTTSTWSSTAWTSIGSKTRMFNGKFNGQNFTIYGAKFAAASEIGFWGYIGESGVVENLSLAAIDTTIITYVGSPSRGGFAAYNYGTIRNCQQKSKKLDLISKSNGGTEYSVNEGGIVAYNYGLIQNCQNYAMVTAGDNTWPAHAIVAGIAAQNYGVIEDSHNHGYINSGVARTNQIAGIASQNQAGGIIRRCSNDGTVHSEYTITYSSYGPEARNGGISAWNKGLIENTYNVASDSSYENTGASYVGCLVGKNEGSSAILRNSYCASSKQYSRGSSSYSGGVAGYNGTGAEITNVYYNSSILSVTTAVASKAGTVTDVSGLSTADMKTKDFVDILNTTNGTTENSKVWTISDSYPIFADPSTPVEPDSFIVLFLAGKDTLQNELLEEGTLPEYKGDKPTKPSTNTHDFTFAGWSSALSEVTANQTYYALFDSSAREYSVAFVSAITVLVNAEYEEKIELIEPEPIDDMIFEGWFNDDGDLIGQPGDQITITADITITAKWHEQEDSSSSIDEEPASSSSDDENEPVDSSSSSEEETVESSSSEVVDEESSSSKDEDIESSSSENDISSSDSDDTDSSSSEENTESSSSEEDNSDIDSSSSEDEMDSSSSDEENEPVDSSSSSEEESIESSSSEVVDEESSSSEDEDIDSSSSENDISSSDSDDTDSSSSSTIDEEIIVDVVKTITLPAPKEHDGFIFIGWFDAEGKFLGMDGDVIPFSGKMMIKGKFKPIVSVAQINPLQQKNMHATVQTINKQLVISNADIGTIFSITNIKGRLIRQGKISSSDHVVEMGQSGRYIVRLGNRIFSVTLR